MRYTAIKFDSTGKTTLQENNSVAVLLRSLAGVKNFTVIDNANKRMILFRDNNQLAGNKLAHRLYKIYLYRELEK
jgi:hypothetical protein